MMKMITAITIIIILLFFKFYEMLGIVLRAFRISGYLGTFDILGQIIL